MFKAADPTEQHKGIQLRSWGIGVGCAAASVAASYVYTLPGLTPKAISLVVGYWAGLPFVHYLFGQQFSFKKQARPGAVDRRQATITAARQSVIRAALDHALETEGNLLPLSSRTPSQSDAEVAVRLSQSNPGAIASKALEWLKRCGFEGVIIHSASGHIALLDTHTHLIHDFEFPEGCMDLSEHTVFKESEESGDADLLNRCRAEDWLKRRHGSPSATANRQVVDEH